MGALHLGLLLHFYQPSWQSAAVLRRIADESYRPLLRVFREQPNARATFNVNGVLSDLLDSHGHGDVLAGLRELGATGRVEFTASAQHHVILPLTPPDEARRQLRLHHETNQRLLGGAYQPRGLFPPEMAWDAATAAQAREAGCQWAVMSGVACPVGWPRDRVYRQATAGGPLALLFRDDVLSNTIAFRNTTAAALLSELRAIAASAAGDQYVVLAMDAETFGHHIPGWEQEFLATLWQLIATSAVDPVVRPSTLSDIVAAFPAAATITPHPSSWSTTDDDLRAGNPYPLWKQRGNELHHLLWRHLEQCLALYQLAEQTGLDTADRRAARTLLDEALSSDPFWWASRRPHWSPGIIAKGLNIQRALLLHAVRAVNLSDAPEEARQQAQERIAIARHLGDALSDRLAWD